MSLSDFLVSMKCIFISSFIQAKNIWFLIPFPHCIINCQPLSVSYFINVSYIHPLFFPKATTLVKSPNIAYGFIISHTKFSPTSQDIWMSYAYRIGCTILVLARICLLLSTRARNFFLVSLQHFFLSWFRASGYTQMPRFLLFFYYKPCSRNSISVNTIFDLKFSLSLRSPVFISCSFWITRGGSLGLRQR